MAKAPSEATLSRRRRRLARIRYELGLEAIAERANGIREFAVLGIRSLVLMNGGGLIGLFTFLGNNQAVAARANALGVLAASVAFVLGLTTALVTLLVAYRVELESLRAMIAEERAEVMRAHDIPIPPSQDFRSPAPPSGLWGVVSLALFVIGALAALLSVLL